MRILYRRCAGLDVHKASVVACVLMVQENNCVEEQVRRFGTMTEDLRELAAWLNSQAVERVAMESTGGVLEACLEHLGGRWAGSVAGQRAAGEGSARPQDRPEGQSMAGRSTDAWIAAEQFRAFARDPGFTRLDAQPSAASTMAWHDRESNSESAGRC